MSEAQRIICSTPTAPSSAGREALGLGVGRVGPARCRRHGGADETLGPDALLGQHAGHAREVDGVGVVANRRQHAGGVAVTDGAVVVGVLVAVAGVVTAPSTATTNTAALNPRIWRLGGELATDPPRPTRTMTPAASRASAAAATSAHWRASGEARPSIQPMPVVLASTHPPTAAACSAKPATATTAGGR